MFLATDLLSDQERQEAFDEAPEATALSLNWNVGLNAVRDGAIDLVDTLLGQNYTKEALGALVDGSSLLVRAAGQISESKAAELYLTTHQPRGWLQRAGQPEAGSENDVKLRLSLIEMPLHLASTYIDAALNHFANAILRFAFEVNLPAAECGKLGLDPTVRVTAPRAWIDWGQLKRRVKAMGPDCLSPRFQLIDGLVRCVEHPDFSTASEFRHSLIHREIPAGLQGPYLKRATANSGGRASINFAKRIVPIELPDLTATRAVMAAALTPCRVLQDAILNFLPAFAEAVGFRISIEGVAVTMQVNVRPSRIVAPPRVIVGAAGQPLSITAQGSLRTDIIPRAHRNPGPFLI